MRRPRLTVRGMMVLVAILALATGILALWIQAERRRDRAMYHAKMEADTASMMRYYRGDMVKVGKAERETFPEKLIRATNRNRYHSEMRRKWETSARRPWLPVAPDPPEPD